MTKTHDDNLRARGEGRLVMDRDSGDWTRDMGADHADPFQEAEELARALDAWLVTDCPLILNVAAPSCVRRLLSLARSAQALRRAVEPMKRVADHIAAQDADSDPDYPTPADMAIQDASYEDITVGECRLAAQAASEHDASGGES